MMGFWHYDRHKKTRLGDSSVMSPRFSSPWSVLYYMAMEYYIASIMAMDPLGRVGLFRLSGHHEDLHPSAGSVDGYGLCCCNKQKSDSQSQGPQWHVRWG